MEDDGEDRLRGMTLVSYSQEISIQFYIIINFQAF